jgi:hypothetical protein
MHKAGARASWGVETSDPPALGQDGNHSFDMHHRQTQKLVRGSDRCSCCVDCDRGIGVIEFFYEQWRSESMDEVMDCVCFFVFLIFRNTALTVHTGGRVGAPIAIDCRCHFTCVILF